MAQVVQLFQTFDDQVSIKSEGIRKLIQKQLDKEFNIPSYNQLKDDKVGADAYHILLEEYFDLMKQVATVNVLLSDCRKLRETIKKAQLAQSIQVSYIKRLQDRVEGLNEDQKTLLVIKDSLDVQLRYLNSIAYMTSNPRTRDRVTG